MKLVHAAASLACTGLGVMRKLYKNVSLVASVFLNGLELVTDP